MIVPSALWDTECKAVWPHQCVDSVMEQSAETLNTLETVDLADP